MDRKSSRGVKSNDQYMNGQYINDIETLPDLYFEKYLRKKNSCIMQVSFVMVLMSLYGADARQSSVDVHVRVHM